MKRYLLLLSLAFAGLSAQGQVMFQERAHRLDSKYKFMCTSDTDRQGNVVLSGLIRLGSADLHNSMILLLKPNTDTLWTRRGPDVPDYATYAGVKFTADGSYALASSTRKSTSFPPLPDDYDGVLQKYSGSGRQLFNRVINPQNQNNGIHSFLTLPDKGYLLNSFEGFSATGSNLVLTRTDSVGTVLWQRNHPNFAPYGLIYTEHAGNGGAIMAGLAYTGAAGSSPYKIKLLLTDANGNAQLGNTLNLTDPSRSEGMSVPATRQCIVRLSDGGYLITGSVDTTDAQTGNYSKLGFVAKVNANLQLVWKYIHRQPPVLANSAYFTKAKELKDGSIMVLGQNEIVRTSAPVNSFQLYRFSSSGQLMAAYPFTSQYSSLFLNTLEALPDGSFVIGGPVPYSRLPVRLLRCQSKDPELTGRAAFGYYGCRAGKGYCCSKYRSRLPEPGTRAGLFPVHAAKELPQSPYYHPRNCHRPGSKQLCDK